METLFRFTPHNTAYKDEVITHSRLWFSMPDAFNDPLDSRLDYRQTYSTEEIEAFWRGFVEGKTDLPQTLYEILGCWGSNESFIEQQKRVFNQFRSQMGVACFSKTPANILMWSHYANHHKGIVYEFEPDLFLDSTSGGFKGHPLKVDYAENNEYELLSYVLTGKPKQDQFVTEQLTKATDWAYEQEYRFIDLNGNGNKAFKKGSLKTIIFGAKMPESEIARIQNLCSQNGLDHVAFKQARFKLGKFEVELVDL